MPQQALEISGDHSAALKAIRRTQRKIDRLAGKAVTINLGDAGRLGLTGYHQLVVAAERGVPWAIQVRSFVDEHRPELAQQLTAALADDEDG